MTSSSKRYGSDLVVDLLCQAGIDHVAFNPGASFRGIHDSLVHNPGAPELTLCMHEMIAVSMTQGYAKATGKMMAAMLHNVVGLQNASMAIYNAWCDRAPVLLLGGTGPKSKAQRRPWIDWIHTASVQANLVRDFVKWDDEPHDVPSIEESFARGIATATSSPPGPVYLCYDVDLQEDPLPDDFIASGIGRYAVPSSPDATPDDVVWMVETLRAAERPVILAGYVAETHEGFTGLAQLAEMIGAPVVDTGVRHAVATTHPLAGTHIGQFLDEADVVLALDVEDIHSHLGSRFGTAGLTVINVRLASLKVRAWAHDYQAMVPAHRHITASADNVAAALAERLHKEPLPHDVVARRVRSITDKTTSMRVAWARSASTATEAGAVPIERMLYEVEKAIAGVPFVLGGGTNGRLEHKYFPLDRPRQYAGWAAGGGLGYGVGGALGVALGQQKGTITVNIQADGDLLFLPSALWTAVNKSLPVLTVVHNNRQYGNTVEHAIKIGNHRGHGTAHRYVGAGLDQPAVDIATMARSFGMWAAGPIADPQTLSEQLAAAVEQVRAGRPALLDVLTPGF